MRRALQVTKLSDLGFGLVLGVVLSVVIGYACCSCAPVRAPIVPAMPTPTCGPIQFKWSCAGKVHEGWPCAECWNVTWASPKQQDSVMACVAEDLGAYCVGTNGCAECEDAYPWALVRDAGAERSP